MERNFYHNDEFEELLKEKADQYKMYPSDKVWKGIDRSLRSYRKWYWTGFVVLLSGISYFAITELMSPVSIAAAPKVQPIAAPRAAVTADELDPFSSELPLTNPSSDIATSDITVEDSGSMSASFEIPLQLFDVPGLTGQSPDKASLVITGLEPLGKHEEYNIELTWPVRTSPSPTTLHQPVRANSIASSPEEDKTRINWLQEQAGLKMGGSAVKRISWQLAFSPTVNYRKLTGSTNVNAGSGGQNIPTAPAIGGNIENLVNHRPALGFELGTHAILQLNRRLTLKGGLQFNYSKYDIEAFRSEKEYATIALNSTLGGPSSLTSLTDIRNFGGNTPESLKNQYFQVSVPVGFEFRILGNDRLQFNVASTIQPTYLLNGSTYLITSDYKSYTKAPSLVRKWNVNAGAEAFVSYNRGGVKWQVGPQFRYQLLSSYTNAYPIKEYLMEYGIKVGITKTIR